MACVVMARPALTESLVSHSRRITCARTHAVSLSPQVCNESSADVPCISEIGSEDVVFDTNLAIDLAAFSPAPYHAALVTAMGISKTRLKILSARSGSVVVTQVTDSTHSGC